MWSPGDRFLPGRRPTLRHMAKKRRYPSILKPDPFHGLYSNQILGALVEALNPKCGPLTGRTARRFFRGSPVNEHNRKEIFVALGQAFIDRGIAPEICGPLPLRVPSARVYADSMEFAARKWDNFMSLIQSGSSWDVETRTAGQCFLHLAVVDLSVRLLALNWMAGIDVRLPSTPTWAEENAIGRALRARLAESGLTRDQLAARIEVSPTSVDNWLDGRHWPDDQYVESMARELADGTGPAASALAKELHRQFTLAKLCEVLSNAVDRDVVISAVDTVSRLVATLIDSVGPRVVSESDMTVFGPLLVLTGSGTPIAHRILEALATELPDEQLKTAVMAATRPWEFAYGEMLMAEGGSKMTAAGLAQDYLDVSGLPTSEEAVAVRMEIRAELGGEIASSLASDLTTGIQHHPVSLLEESISSRRRLVGRFPNSPEAHYQLGSWLGLVGKFTGQQEFISEGLVECQIASGLCPSWDAPAVERGLILTNFGDHRGALRELEQVGKELPELTPHWRFVMGYVLTTLERFPEGLEQLEAVIKVRPDFGLAYAYAARCAFGLRDKVRGREYAKKARLLGDSSEYDAWRTGAYGGRRDK